MMNDMEEKEVSVEVHERLTRVEEVAASSHKRHDKVDTEIVSLRESRHKHNALLHTHATVIGGMESSVKGLSGNVEKLTSFANKLIWVSVGGTSVGVGLIALLIFLADKILKIVKIV